MILGQNQNAGIPIRRIGILRALFLGDLLCSIPAIRAIREMYPEAEISLIGLPWSAQFVRRYASYLDSYIEFPGYPGLPERQPDPKAIPGFISSIQAREFDLVIQMHGSGRIVNPLAVLFNGRITAGFYDPGEFCPGGTYFIPYPDEGPELTRMMRLVEKLGCHVNDYALQFPISHSEEGISQQLLQGYGLSPGEYICLHPGSRSAKRRWSTEGFARVGNFCTERGYQVVLTGTNEEKNILNEVAIKMREAPVNLCGETDLGSLAGILRGSRMLICNDTGVSHLADALKVPSVILFTGSDPDRWAPLDRQLHRVIQTQTVSDPVEVTDVVDELLGEKQAIGIGN